MLSKYTPFLLFPALQCYVVLLGVQIPVRLVLSMLRVMVHS